MPKKGHDNMDSLLRPSISNESNGIPKPGSRPWNFNNTFWLAFLGGVAPITVMAYINAKRLDMPVAKQRLFILVGALGMLVVLSFTAYTAPQLTINKLFDRGNHIFSISRLSAVVVWLIVRWQMITPLRIYDFRFADEALYDSMWKPALLSILLFGSLQTALVIGIVAILGK
jgi:hypothetical protein